MCEVGKAYDPVAGEAFLKQYAAMFKDQLDMNDLGYITSNHLMETSVPGVFVAGEVTDSHFRQVVTSAGMGAAAAIQATHFLEKETVSA